MMQEIPEYSDSWSRGKYSQNSLIITQLAVGHCKYHIRSHN